METIRKLFRAIGWILLLPVRLIRWVLRALLWLIALPFRIIDAILKAPFWFFRWIYSFLFRRRTVPATILRMWQESYMADYNSYVLFDSRGKKIKIRLTMYENNRFFANNAEGDIGRLTHRGAWLVKWQPATADQPIVLVDKKAYAFLSYAHEWTEEAQYIAEFLGSRGVTVWFDEQRLQVGDSLTDGVVNAIEKTSFFIPLLSRHYFLSEWCVRELEKALETKRRILPIKVEDGDLLLPPHLSKKLKSALQDLIFIDLRKTNPLAKLNQLIDIMRE